MTSSENQEARRAVVWPLLLAGVAIGALGSYVLTGGRDRAPPAPPAAGPAEIEALRAAVARLEEKLDRIASERAPAPPAASPSGLAAAPAAGPATTAAAAAAEDPVARARTALDAIPPDAQRTAFPADGDPPPRVWGGGVPGVFHVLREEDVPAWSRWRIESDQRSILGAAPELTVSEAGRTAIRSVLEDYYARAVRALLFARKDVEAPRISAEARGALLRTYVTQTHRELREDRDARVREILNRELSRDGGDHAHAQFSMPP